jgi:hypothetical protein
MSNRVIHVSYFTAAFDTYYTHSDHCGVQFYQHTGIIGDMGCLVASCHEMKNIDPDGSVAICVRITA